MATGTPALKEMTTSSASRGSAGFAVYSYTSSIGAFQMSSRKPVSTARPKTFWSMEYGDFLDVAIGRSFASQKAMALSRVIA